MVFEHSLKKLIQFINKMVFEHSLQDIDTIHKQNGVWTFFTGIDTIHKQNGVEHSLQEFTRKTKLVEHSLRNWYNS